MTVKKETYKSNILTGTHTIEVTTLTENLM